MTIAIACLGIASCGQTPDAGRVIARVEGKEITYGDLLKELQAKRGPIALLEIVDERLIRHEAAAQGIDLTEDEREAAYERAAARVGSVADLQRSLDSAGISKEAYRRSIETDMLLDKIAREKVEVTDSEVTKYYRARLSEFECGERVRARMMLFLDKQSAETVLQVLADPEADFAGLAKSLSEDDATNGDGGDMGYFERDDYAPAITEAAFGLEPGKTSGLIEAPDGWVILRVEDKKPAGPMSLDEVHEQIRQRLIRERQRPVREKWLIEARKSGAVKIRDKALREDIEKRMEFVKPEPMPGQL